MIKVYTKYLRGGYNQFLSGQEKVSRESDLNPKKQTETSEAEELVWVRTGHSRQSKQHVQMH